MASTSNNPNEDEIKNLIKTSRNMTIQIENMFTEFDQKLITYNKNKMNNTANLDNNIITRVILIDIWESVQSLIEFVILIMVSIYRVVNKYSFT